MFGATDFEPFRLGLLFLFFINFKLIPQRLFSILFVFIISIFVPYFRVILRPPHTGTQVLVYKSNFGLIINTQMALDWSCTFIREKKGNIIVNERKSMQFMLLACVLNICKNVKNNLACVVVLCTGREKKSTQRLEVRTKRTPFVSHTNAPISYECMGVHWKVQGVYGGYDYEKRHFPIVLQFFSVYFFFSFFFRRLTLNRFAIIRTKAWSSHFVTYLI